MGYFNRIESYEDLKSQYKKLLKEHHPDNGGDSEIMKQINIEYDALFMIWKNKREQDTGEKVNETADSTRKEFYTMFGWEGSNHDWNRSLKEVAQIVRKYVKEKYPTYKFSVRTDYASMCKELCVKLKESPVEIYKKYEELTEQDKYDFIHKASCNGYWNLSSWNDEEFRAEYNRITEKHGNFFRIMNEITKSVAEDVDSFVNSYNYHDCDGSIDYFHVDFYYFGCCENNGVNVKVVPKTARIKNADADVIKAAKNSDNTVNTDAPEIGQAEDNPGPGQDTSAAASGYTYIITQGEDTRDGSALWVVRIKESLDKDSYIAESMKMHDLGAYYSKFLHGFVFRYDPTEVLIAKNNKQPEQEQNKEIILLIQNNNLTKYSLVSVMGMDRQELMSVLSAMSEDNKLSIQAYLESKGAWTTEIANEGTKEIREYHLDVRYNTDTDELVDMKERKEKQPEQVTVPEDNISRRRGR